MQLLAEQRSLNVLWLGLRHRPRPNMVELCLLMGEREVGHYDLHLSDFGLETESTREERYTRRGSSRDPARDATLSEWVPRDLEALLAPALEGDEPLWLGFKRSAALLVQLPWETWLTKIAKRPILRLSYLAVQPAEIGEHPEILVCSSMPRAKAAFPVADLLRQTLEHVLQARDRARFHVFVDLHEHDEVSRALEDIAQATVYDPAQASPFGTAPRVRGLRAESEGLESPWLKWMKSALAGRSMNLAMFLCHGFLADGAGSLAFAESPLFDEDSGWARFVGNRELVTFLDHLGAAYLALGSPRSNFSVSGTRALADEIARHRPGAVMVLDLADESPSTLGPALDFLFGAGRKALPATERMLLYCHPDLVEAGPPIDLRRGRDSTSPLEMETYTLAKHATIDLDSGSRQHYSVPGTGTGGETESSAEAPGWAAPSQRVLERYVADLKNVEDDETATGQAIHTGRSDALKYVAELLQKSLAKGTESAAPKREEGRPRGRTAGSGE